MDEQNEIIVETAQAEPETPEVKKKPAKKKKNFAPLFILSAVMIAVIFFGLGSLTTLLSTAAAMRKGTLRGNYGVTANELSDIMSEEGLQKLGGVRKLLNELFLFSDRQPDYDTAIIKGYVNALDDPYTVYYSEDEYKALMEDMSGSFGGVGVTVQIDVDTGLIRVVRTLPGTPAEEVDVQAEDIISKVNGEDISGLSLDLVVAKIRGEIGTTVDVQFYRPSTGEYLDKTLTRALIQVEYVTHEMLDHQIGYISMSSFTDTTYDQFMEAFNDLKSQNMKGLIVDIRDNGGGLLTSVVDILDRLLPEGIITYTEDRDGNREEYRSDAATELTVPMVVLVNGNSASASEIFTGAIKDYGVGTIMGTRTFGKGIVQLIYDLQDGTALKLTTSRYFTPNGICIHGVGIEPDITVELDRTNPDVDEQLDAAISELEKQMEK